MCIICQMIDKEQLTHREAFAAFIAGEVDIPESHWDEVTNKIADMPNKKEDDLKDIEEAARKSFENLNLGPAVVFDDDDEGEQ